MEEEGKGGERWQPGARSAQLAGCEGGGRGHGPRSEGKETESLERNKALPMPPF